MADYTKNWNKENTKSKFGYSDPSHHKAVNEARSRVAKKMIDNVGQNSHKKDSIKGVGSMKNSNRSMP